MTFFLTRTLTNSFSFIFQRDFFLNFNSFFNLANQMTFFLTDKFLVIECVILFSFTHTVHHSKPPSIQVSERITKCNANSAAVFPPTYELQLSFPEYKLIPAFPLSLFFLTILKLQECLLRQKNGYKTTHTHTHTSGLKKHSSLCTFCATLLLDCGYLFQLLLLPPANTIPTVAEMLLLSSLLMQHRFLAPME